MNARAVFVLLLSFFLCSCGTVTVKQIAGEQVPEELPASLDGGTWRGADGAVCRSRVKDAKKGIVEFQTKDADGKEEKTLLVIRTLGDRLVFTMMGEEAKGDEPYLFGRLAVSDEHLALFLPATELLKEAVKKGTLAGEVREDKMVTGPEGSRAAQKYESTVLEKFGIAEAEKLGGVLACFDADPAAVFVREAAPKEKPQKKGKAKK